MPTMTNSSSQTMPLCSRCSLPLLEEGKPCVSCSESPSTSPSGRFTRGRIGPYRIVDAIGAGSTGRVFLCREDGHDKPLAVKVLSAEGMPLLADQWMGDARAVSRVKHEGLIAIRSIGRARENRFIAMEALEGSSVACLIAERGPLAEREALLIMRAAVLALNATFERGMTHRALRPSALFVCRDGTVKLSDYGQVAPAAYTDHADGPALEARRFLSPEQHRRQTVDHRSDIYGLGTILFFALTGQKPPVTADGTWMPPLVNEIVPRVHAAMVPLVERMTQTSAAARHQTHSELLSEIDGVLASLSIADQVRFQLTATGDFEAIHVAPFREQTIDDGDHDPGSTPEVIRHEDRVTADA